MNKVAILIDGAFYLKRLPHVKEGVNDKCAKEVAGSIREIIRGHLEKLTETQEVALYNDQEGDKSSTLMPHLYAQHYRTFYYDASPYEGTLQSPIKNSEIDYSETKKFKFQKELFSELRHQNYVALRLGETKPQGSKWTLRPEVFEKLLQKEKRFSELTDRDFIDPLRQKGVDMRMGIDMTSMILKKQANIFVLVTGDADFIPAAKLVRREGGHIILDPLENYISRDLYEHIDGLVSVFANSEKKPAK